MDDRMDDGMVDGVDGRADDGVIRATPKHLWVVGGLALIWNLFGCYDYLMSRLHNDAYARMVMPGRDPAVGWAYMDSMPLIASIGWGLGVWGALAATVLLLARSRHAVTLYLASLVGMALSFGYQALLGPPPPPGMDNPMIPLVIVAIGIALFVYARQMRIKGVLR
ncbi:MAG: hypothetical protein ABIR51_00550 [Sphingomicrobium sp.]